MKSKDGMVDYPAELRRYAEDDEPRYGQKLLIEAANYIEGLERGLKEIGAMPKLPLRGADWELSWTGCEPPETSAGGDWYLVAVNSNGGCLWARRRT